MSVKIVAAAAHWVVREHLVSVLSSRIFPPCIVPCPSGRGVLSLSGDDGISHIVMELNFTDIDGLDVLLALKHSGCTVPVTVCLDRFDPHTIMLLDRLHPHSILDMQGEVADKFSQAMMASVSGKPHYAGTFVNAVASFRSDLSMPRFTGHQLELIAMFARGYDDKSVARITSAAPFTPFARSVARSTGKAQCPAHLP